MEETFLLTTPQAQHLYRSYAVQLPIIDYHNHLSMKDLTSDRCYENLARLWLVSDPYKHRAMRICGVSEEQITGDASDYEKFMAWMEVLPKLLGNPLYDWSILEMKRVFDIDLIPGKTDPDWLWNTVNELLAQAEYTALGILEKFPVEYASPCAAICDDIRGYQRFSKLAPSLRCDELMGLDLQTIASIAQMTGATITNWDDYCRILRLRLDAFQEAGCRFADHALDHGFSYHPDDGGNEERFRELLSGRLDMAERQALSCHILRFLAGEYSARGWIMQLHMGAQRSTSSRLRQIAGPAGGFAAIGKPMDPTQLTRLLDDLESAPGGLPQTILFTLNPADNAAISILSGSYSRDGLAGLVRQGPAWWWCDHMAGMREVFEAQAAYSVLSQFVGMTTDSRSILSMVRHEYFRRVFCGWLGEKLHKGELIAGEEQLKQLIFAVCFGNAREMITGGNGHAF